MVTQLHVIYVAIARRSSADGKSLQLGKLKRIYYELCNQSPVIGHKTPLECCTLIEIFPVIKHTILW